ncbi:MAG: hypothetical protein ABI833_15320 [Acidobacteriota bacterium]
MNRVHRLVPVVVLPTSAAARRRTSPRRISPLRTWVKTFGVWTCLLFAATVTANAQFKVVGPAPVTPTVARQQFRTLLDNVDPNNSRETTEKLSRLLAWYRDILDEELIAAWQKDSRANLPDVIESLATSRVATAIVEFSWRQQRAATLDLPYASMFGHLMTRFPESAQPFVDDLLGRGKPTPNLSDREARTVCRILLDMPEIGMWRQNALEILPHYRQAAENLLAQDMRGSDEEKSYQARRWLADLKSDVSGVGNEQPSPGRRTIRSRPSLPNRAPSGERTVSILMPPAAADRVPAAPATSSQPAQPVRSAPPAAPAPAPAPAALAPSPAPAPAPAPAPSAVPAPANSLPAAPSPSTAAPSPSTAVSSLPPGPRSGTLECSGGQIPQNAEYVFHNLPPGTLQLDYDAKTWDARLVAGEGQTQRLILKNKSRGPQKRCMVQWRVIP